MKDLLTTPEVAEIVGLSEGRIRQLIIAKRLPAKKYGKINLVERKDLALIEKRTHGRPRKNQVAA